MLSGQLTQPFPFGFQAFLCFVSTATKGLCFRLHFLQPTIVPSLFGLISEARDRDCHLLHLLRASPRQVAVLDQLCHANGLTLVLTLNPLHSLVTPFLNQLRVGVNCFHFFDLAGELMQQRPGRSPDHSHRQGTDRVRELPVSLFGCKPSVRLTHSLKQLLLASAGVRANIVCLIGLNLCGRWGSRCEVLRHAAEQPGDSFLSLGAHCRRSIVCNPAVESRQCSRFRRVLFRLLLSAFTRSAAVGDVAIRPPMIIVVDALLHLMKSLCFFP
jgi:hypothetical protein